MHTNTVAMLMTLTFASAVATHPVLYGARCTFVIPKISDKNEIHVLSSSHLERYWSDYRVACNLEKSGRLEKIFKDSENVGNFSGWSGKFHISRKSGKSKGIHDFGCGWFVCQFYVIFSRSILLRIS